VTTYNPERTFIHKFHLAGEEVTWEVPPTWDEWVPSLPLAMTCFVVE
jgi:hypothetical protein